MALAESVRAPRAVPPFDNSAMDGFAVRAADLRGPIDPSPICLEIVATIPAGTHWRGKIQLGQAAKIMTGAAMPRGANTVVPVESTREEGGWVEILTMPAMGSNVRRRGGDLGRGRVALRRRARLTPAALTLIASLGLTHITCWRRPRVAILASGSELIVPGQPLPRGHIYESSHWALCETLRALGAEVTFLGIARDDRAETRRLIRRGLRGDVLLTAGGVSVGEFDFIRDELARCGADEIFWRVAQRPGKPLLFAATEQTLVFGLPGNPVSSLVSTEMYVKPALRQMMGFAKSEIFPPRLRLPTAEQITKPPRLRTFHRASFTVAEGRVALELTRSDQSSGIFSTMLDAHALTNLPPRLTVIEPGEEVECFVLNPEALVRVMQR